MLQAKPIETAPKDGREVLIFAEDMWISANYHKHEWHPGLLSWYGCGCCGGDLPQPTHWCELPEVPGTEPGTG